jgi:septation ring formation regulator EzrA
MDLNGHTDECAIRIGRLERRVETLEHLGSLPVRELADTQSDVKHMAQDVAARLSDGRERFERIEKSLDKLGDELGESRRESAEMRTSLKHVESVMRVGVTIGSTVIAGSTVAIVVAMMKLMAR